MERDADHAARDTVDVIGAGVRHVQRFGAGRDVVEKAKLEFREVDGDERRAIATVESTDRIHVDYPQSVTDYRHSTRRMKRGSTCSARNEPKILDHAFRTHAGNEAVVVLCFGGTGAPVADEVDVLVRVVANSFGLGKSGT